MLLASAFFSGMEIAFVTSNKLKIELEKSKGGWSGRLLSPFTQTPARLIASLLVGNNIALVVYGIAITHKLESWLSNSLVAGLGNPFVLFLIQTLLSTLLILVFAEFLPKMLFRINANALLSFFAFPVAMFYYLFFPLVVSLTKIAEFILKYLFGVDVPPQGYQFSPVDLDNYLNEVDSDQLDQSEERQEIEMFQNAMDFHLVKVRECMVPRNEIIAIGENEPIEELHSIMIEKGYSRIPVYSDNIDNIIGYAHVFDLYQQPSHIAAIIKPIVIVPETMTADKALTIFTQQHKSIALVVDEFGGTAGIVTMEDLIEEIFGEIDDEFDQDENIETELSDHEYIFSARLEIDYLNKEYHLDLPESDMYETLAGLIIHHHESIPLKNEEINIGKFLFIIESATRTKIGTVKLVIVPER